jgi:hypothetical protein
MGYIDDSLLVADEKDDCIRVAVEKDDCIRNVNDTICLFEKVGFIIHDNKSIVVLIDSVKMVVTLSVDKIDNIIQECKVLLKK